MIIPETSGRRLPAPDFQEEREHNKQALLAKVCQNRRPIPWPGERHSHGRSDSRDPGVPTLSARRPGRPQLCLPGYDVSASSLHT